MSFKDDDKQWGTRTEAAAILGVHAKTLERWLKTDKIGIRHLGARLSLNDIRRLLEVGEEEYVRERRWSDLSPGKGKQTN